MTHNEIRSFLERYVRAWERQDIDALLDCYAKGAEIVSPMLRTRRGEAEIEASFQDLFLAFGDFVLTIDDVVIDTQSEGGAIRAVMIMTTHATHRGEIFGMAGSGRRVESQMMFAFRFAGDRIKSERRLYDFTGLLVQLGVLKTKHA